MDDCSWSSSVPEASSRGNNCSPIATDLSQGKQNDAYNHTMQYKMSASFLEIYNKTLCDLFCSSSTNQGNSTVSHEIKIDPERSGHVISRQCQSLLRNRYIKIRVQLRHQILVRHCLGGLLCDFEDWRTLYYRIPSKARVLLSPEVFQIMYKPSNVTASNKPNFVQKIMD